jgi:hypothetical protein
VTLEDAIALVASQAAARGVSLTRTKLVKLLYFVDLRAWEQLGHTVTGVEWIWHQYGPYSSSIIEACDRMSASGELGVVATANYYGSPEWRISSVEPLYFNPPGHDLVSVVRAVVHEFGPLTPARIGDLSYETLPMRRLVSSGQRGDPIEFEADVPTRRDVKQVAARYAERARRNVGRDEGDIAEGLSADTRALEHPRRLASGRMLQDS